VVTPLLTGLENASPLPHASTLCGMCKEVCPVDIDIPRMLLDLRADLVALDQSEVVWDVGMKVWARGVSSPATFSLGGRMAALAGKVLPGSLPGPLKGWTVYRTPPRFAEKPFRLMWRERRERRRDSDEQP
jgi:L-lactate dehydrogenase complex protein LldF